MKQLEDIDWKNEIKQATMELFIRQLWRQSYDVKKPAYVNDKKSIFFEFIILQHIETCKKRPFCYCQLVVEVLMKLIP